MQQLGSRYPDLLEAHKGRVRSVIEKNSGTEVATEGDSFFVVFRSAQAGVAAAAEAQRSLAETDWQADVELKVRMGLHTGEAAVVGGSYVGLDVHRAARISGAAFGGQVLLSRACADLVEGQLPAGVTLRDLGDHRLKDLSRAERIKQLVIDGLPSDFPPLRGANPTLDNLPPQLTSFVGRRKELDELADLLSSARMITLLGPGGTGKTRLAIELAAAIGDRFRDGVRFVPLAEVTDPALVPPAVGQALEIVEAGRGSERPGARLMEYLRDREMLLLIDNVEQVVAAGGFLGELLRAAPDLRLLVTSRTVLDVDGEHVYRVPPLLDSESTSLFVQRARAVRSGFAVTPENATAIVEICARLDGLPLAIELAASRVRILSPQAILARLGDRLGLLRREGAGGPARQRALWDTIAWSHDLLDVPERRLFARLAAFRGGGTIAEIAAVMEGTSVPLGVDVLDGLTSLSDKSLLNVIEDRDAEPRFGMLRTIAEFAVEQLERGDEADELHDRHLDVFLALAEEAEPRLLTAGRRPWLDRLEAELDNFRAALDWAVSRQRVQSALRLGAALWRLWQIRGYLSEARSRIEAIISLPGVESHPRDLARAYEAAGGITHWQGDQTVERIYYGHAVRIGRELGDGQLVANGLFNLAYSHLPLVLTADDDPSVPEAFLQEADEIFRRIGDDVGLARVWEARAVQAFFRREWQRATELAVQGVSQLRRTDDTHYLAWCLDIMGDSALQLGNLDEAGLRLSEALGLFAAARDLSGIAVVLDELAALSLRLENWPAAMRLASAANELAVSSGTSFAVFARRVPQQKPPDRTMAGVGDVELLDAWEEGRTMSVDEVVAYALEQHAPEEAVQGATST